MRSRVTASVAQSERSGHGPWAAGFLVPPIKRWAYNAAHVLVGGRPVRRLGDCSAPGLFGNRETGWPMTEGLRIYNLFASPWAAGPIGDCAAALPHIAGMAFNAVCLDLRLGGKAKRSDDERLGRFTAAAAGHGLRVIADLRVDDPAKNGVPAARRPGRL